MTQKRGKLSFVPQQNKGRAVMSYFLLPFSAKKTKASMGIAGKKHRRVFANVRLGYFGTFTATLLTMFEAGDQRAAD